jgi:hypothetical protein
MRGDGSVKGRRIVVCPAGNVARVLSIVAAETALSLHDGLEDALHEVRAGG